MQIIYPKDLMASSQIIEWSSATTYADGDVVWFGEYTYTSQEDSNLDNNPELKSKIWEKGDFWEAGTSTLVLTSTTAVAQVTAWNSGTSYIIGDEASVQDNFGFAKVYICLVAHDDIHPVTHAQASVKWSYDRYDNNHAMFDGYVNKQSIKATSIVVVLDTTEQIDDVVLFNIDGSTINVTCNDGASDVSDVDYSLTFSSPTGEDFTPMTGDYKDAVVCPIPGSTYNTLTITITITAAAGRTAKCGMCVAGRSATLGKTRYAPAMSIVDYSTKDTNDFGETYLNQRAYAKTISADLFFDTGDMVPVYKLLTAVRSTICVWDFNNDSTDYESLIVYGFYKDFDVILQNLAQSICTIEIEGLI